MVSATKKVPGIEFQISLREVRRGSEWIGCEWKEVRATLYFSGKGTEWSLKKLAYAGMRSGVSLRDMNLAGNTVQLTSQMDGEYENYDLALPPRQSSEKSSDAFLAIDAILQATPITEVKLPEPIDPNATQAPDAVSTSAPAPAAPEQDAPGFDFNDGDDDVPF
jgi:hypothetical protein